MRFEKFTLPNSNFHYFSRKKWDLEIVVEITTKTVINIIT